ncbi:hypothetical protein BKA65DRAFT_582704 [Rhexocercosporidium sp. MPI-PUGE-AT-0058]|nr:hypothetical protein BKA65DRAFT_582704 [Rhexocercosporidium sp. MPI-PUGE-AT-0058]
MGLSAAWTVIWAAVLVLIRKPEREFKRIRKLEGKYVWKGFPETMGWKRVGWVLDLMLNPRGVEWAHRRRIAGLPAPILEMYVSPHAEEKCEDHNVDQKLPRSETPEPESNRVFLAKHAALFLLDWTVVEIATHGMTLDPFLNRSITFSLNFEGIEMLPYRLAVAAMGCYDIIDLFLVSLSLVGVGVIDT